MKGEWIRGETMRELEAAQTDAIRLCTAEMGFVERYGPDVLVSFKNEAAGEQLKAEYFEWAQNVAFAGRRIFGRYLPRRDLERTAPRLWEGDQSLPLRVEARENALRYGIDFGAGYSAGLFIDQRENRRFVRGSGCRRMLNCFAYTCSFSVAAAVGGASTMSVDLSRRSLERGRENFTLNKLSKEGHRFIADDVFEVLPRLARRGERFDLLVLDPPTFSRSKRGEKFQVEADFERLLSAALDVTEKEGRILLSTNCARLNEQALQRMARFCLKTARRGARFHRGARPVEFPPGSGASTLWLTLA